ncbi:MAG: PrsW family intramembrane metalloprotease [Lachnospiraceae bacterium]|nr:PrsW family intramembrane metalloprotease [Lachnospiraceae bacterium]
MEQKYCVHCGTQLDPSCRFCTNCGKRLIFDNVRPQDLSVSNRTPVNPVSSGQIPFEPGPINPDPGFSTGQFVQGPQNITPVRRQDKKTSVKLLPILLIAFLSISALITGSTMIDAGAGITIWGILVFGCVPPIALLIYIYRLDRVEKEPVSLLALLFAFGALAIIPPIIIGDIFDGIIELLHISTDSLFYLILENFLAVALVEELSKYFVVKRLTWKHPAFSYRFDGVVYGATAALGFALIENIFYIAGDGVGSAIARAATAIPGHCMFGIYIGYYYGQAKAFEVRGLHGKSMKMRIRGVLTAAFMHGLYDFVCSLQSDFMAIVLFILIAAYNVIAYINVNKYAKQDEMI